jgi:cell pole-organizing protein PopZ
MSGQAEAPPPLDPSMEDILASIRRILNEDEEAPATAPAAAAAAVAPAPDEDPFPLTPEMIVTPPEPPSAEPDPPAAAWPAPAEPPPEGGLVAPAVAAAAAAALGSLTRSAAPERATRLSAGGPTLEDLVRDEIRPLLKEWLDANLPALVERVVRSEIERVVNRAAG